MPHPIFMRPRVLLAIVAVLFVALALARPLDHDESQYVAAAVLARGGLPYRDFAYLQTPLQPLLFAPLAALFGGWAWPGLRIVNALLGVVAVAGVWRAAREAGADRATATAGAALFACCDILLFSAGTARNDALPAALLAAALPPIVRAERESATPAAAALTGLLLAAAAAAKISYALPALAYGLYALADRRRRPLWIAIGATPMAALIAWTFAAAPAGFVFGVFTFPARAPAQWYLAQGRPWKLSLAAKAIDTAKFLALGPALLAAVVTIRAGRPSRVLALLALAGLVSALLPAPTWRQYLLPALPPLFVLLAIAWQRRPPGAALRVASVVFACAGVAPSVEALLRVPAGGLPMAAAARQSAAIRAALDGAGVAGPVATLSPQFLPATGRPIDPGFATGPFYFRAQGLLDPAAAAAIGAVPRDRPAIDHAAAILIGGEGPWTSGDAGVDAVLERWAVAHRWRHVPVSGGRFRLYIRPG